MGAYDKDWTDKLTVAPNMGGKNIYLGLTVTGAFDHDNKDFAPTKCIVKDTDNDLEYTLFDVELESCSNDAIDLSVTYDAASNMWRITHKLFLLNDHTESTFQLECTVSVCDATASQACDDVGICFDGGATPAPTPAASASLTLAPNDPCHPDSDGVGGIDHYDLPNRDGVNDTILALEGDDGESAIMLKWCPGPTEFDLINDGETFGIRYPGKIDTIFLRAIDKDALSRFPEITMFDLQYQEMITTLPETLLYHTPLVTQFHMKSSGLVSLPDKFFAKTPDITRINIYNSNQFATISEGLFAGLTQLEVLNLERCGLTSMAPLAFKDLVSMTSLNMGENRQLTTIYTETFATTTSLMYLNLQKTGILNLKETTIAAAGIWSSSLAKLTNINFKSTVDDTWFCVDGLTLLNLVDLSSKQLCYYDLSSNGNLAFEYF